MRVTLPLRLTGSGQDSRNSKRVTIIYSDGTFRENISVIDSAITTKPFNMYKSSGWDATEARITNIVGFNGEEFLKLCPKCHSVKTTVEFGPEGRVTTSRRDQSECISCRSSY